MAQVLNAARSAAAIAAAIAAAGTLLAAAPVQAQGLSEMIAGKLGVRLGVTRIAPDVTSGDLSAPAFAGTKADIRADTQITGGLSWAINDNITLDLPLAAGFTHEIVGDGAIAGVGKIGEVKALPITLLAQYRFFGASAPLRPYLGIGPTYAKFYKARSTAALTALTGGTPANPTTLAMESKLALTAQLGLAWRWDKQWGVDASVTKTALKTRATLSTGQTLDAKVDPWSFSLGVSYQF